MTNKDLVLINPPALIEKPPIQQSGTLYIPESMLITAMNPGLLSLATYIDDKGFDVRILDLSDKRDYDALDKGLDGLDAGVVGISSTSGLDYIESLKIAELAKRHADCKVVMGGQHAGPLGETVFEDSEFVDAVVRHEGEITLEQILDNLRHNRRDIFNLPGVTYRDGNKTITVPGRPRIVKLNELPPLRYEIYPNFLRFTPFVEESRGCMFRCRYCTSNTIFSNKIDIKNPQKFLVEMQRCIDLFGKDKAYAVLASTFGVNPTFGREIARGMKKFGIKWNSEFRVDSPWEKYIDDLLESGYEVVNVGVESGSPEILRLMGKTPDPERYLAKMKMLARRIAPSDAVIRANFMFYAGESPRTINETIRFLYETPEIDSVQFSPLLVFHGTPLYEEFGTFEREYGSEMVRSEYWERRHLYPVHPSRYFSFQEMATFGQTLEKIFSREHAWAEAAKSLYTQETEEDRNRVKETLIKSKFRRQE